MKRRDHFVGELAGLRPSDLLRPHALMAVFSSDLCMQTWCDLLRTTGGNLATRWQLDNEVLKQVNLDMQNLRAQLAANIATWGQSELVAPLPLDILRARVDSLSDLLKVIDAGTGIARSCCDMTVRLATYSLSEMFSTSNSAAAKAITIAAAKNLAGLIPGMFIVLGAWDFYEAAHADKERAATANAVLNELHEYTHTCHLWSLQIQLVIDRLSWSAPSSNSQAINEQTEFVRRASERVELRFAHTINRLKPVSAALQW